MKRGGPIQRRTPLGRAGAISRVSLRRTEDLEVRSRIREAVFTRDGWLCVLAHRHELLGECHGHLTPHHLWKASRGGPYSMENLVSLCSGHNDRVEDEPLLAHSYGLVVRSGETSGLAWDRMREWGLVP